MHNTDRGSYCSNRLCFSSFIQRSPTTHTLSCLLCRPCLLRVSQPPLNPSPCTCSHPFCLFLPSCRRLLLFPRSKQSPSSFSVFLDAPEAPYTPLSMSPKANFTLKMINKLDPARSTSKGVCMSLQFLRGDNLVGCPPDLLNGCVTHHPYDPACFRLKSDTCHAVHYEF